MKLSKVSFEISKLYYAYDIVKEISAPPEFITFSCDLNWSIIPISFSVALHDIPSASDITWGE